MSQLQPVIVEGGHTQLFMCIRFSQVDLFEETAGPLQLIHGADELSRLGYGVRLVGPMRVWCREKAVLRR